MRCPHCRQDVPLTWSVYLRHLHGRYPCARCGQRMRSNLPFAYKLDLLAIDLVIWGIPFAYGVWQGFTLYGLVKVTVLSLLLVALPATMLVDRYVEDRHAPIVKARGPGDSPGH